MAKTDSVVDAGPLIHLDELESLDLLGDVSSLITVDTVWEEARKHRPALSDLVPQSLRLVPLAMGPSKELSVLVETLNLDAGEKDALIFGLLGSGLKIQDTLDVAAA